MDFPMKVFTHCFRIGFTTALTFLSASALAQVILTDTFDSGVSPAWSNLRGNWVVNGGVYYATQPNNIPPTYSGLPLVLQNFAIDVDINQVADGGIWLRCDDSGTNGVLLVTGGNGWGSGIRGGNAGRSLYWHVITHANYNNPPKLNEAFNVFANPGVDNVHLRIEVIGNLYSVFLNGSTNATTSLLETDNSFSSGHVGLYDFSTQTFDNFILQIPPGFGPYNLAISSPTANQATLLWPTNAVGWALQSSAGLSNPAWDSVTNSPLIANTNFTVTVAATNAQQFFRLYKP
jgi:hypothetical protein